MNKCAKSFLGVFCLIITCFLLPSTSTAEQSLPLPQTEIAERIFDFGQVRQGTVVEHEFNIKNSGAAPLKILKIHTDCGCTAASLDSYTIPAGAAAKIKMSFDTENFDGPKVKTARIYTNDPKESSVVLSLKGEVVPEVVVDPAVLDFGIVREGNEYQKTALVFAEQSSGIKIVDVRSHSLNLDVITEDYSKAGFIGKKLNVVLRSGISQEVFRGRIAIRTTSSKNPVISMAVLARVQGDVDINPPALTFGTVSLPLTKEVSKQAIISNEGSAPLSITSVSSDSSNLKAEFSVLEPGKKYQLKVSLSGDSPAIIRARVKINAESGPDKQKVLTLPVYAILEKKID